MPVLALSQPTPLKPEYTHSELPLKTPLKQSSFMDPEMYKCSPPVCLNIILSHWASIPLIRYTARGGEKTLI